MIKYRKMLITGVSGLLGNNLAFYFKDKYEVLGIYNSHPVTMKDICTEKCDLLDADSLKKIIIDFNPSIIIHCASLTNIDQCEAEKDLTNEVNVLSTRSLVNCISGRDVKLIYISTDTVYGGVKGNFSENDAVSPPNYYGRTKHQGELEVLNKDKALVFRTNIFGWNVQNKYSLGEWVLNELKEKREIRCFKDAFFSSIYTFEFARVIDIAIQKGLSGIYNCGSTTSCSKYEFALKIADVFALDKNGIIPFSIDDFGFRAKRGKDLSLNVSKLETELQYRLPTIEESVLLFYRDYKSGLPDVLRSSLAMEPAEYISYGKQWIDENDIQAVVSTLRSDRLTQGPKIDEFEKALAGFCGARFAVAVNSGTSALHIACLAAGVQEGDEVITSPNTFVASANCAVYCGARPVFADIEPDTYNIIPQEMANKITPLTKAVIPVHFSGQSCDMVSIKNIIQEEEKSADKKIYIIEDACHALGSAYKGRKIGSCFYSDMTVMSFHPVKHITTGEGGAVLTNNESLYNRLKRFRSHGITSVPDEFIYKEEAFETSEGGFSQVRPWYYEQVALGYNYRITDLQCALGISQLKKIVSFCKRRREIVNMYNEAFNDVNTLQTPFQSGDCDSYFHIYVLLFDWKAIGMNRTQFMLELRSRGIQTQVHYIPVPLHPYYRENFGTDLRDFPNTEKYYKGCLSIPLYPAMTDMDAKKVVAEILRLAVRS